MYGVKFDQETFVRMPVQQSHGQYVDKLFNEIKKTQEDMQCKSENDIESFLKLSESNWKTTNDCTNQKPLRRQKRHQY